MTNHLGQKSGRAAIVTGASRGIVFEISVSLARQGWRVIGVDRQWSAAPNTHINRQLTLDVSDFEAVKAAVDELNAEGSEVSCVVNNAGITRDGVTHRMEPLDFEAVIGVNLCGPFNLCRATLGHMRARGWGRVINLSSMNTLRGQVGQPNYSAAKAGLIGFTKTVELENASKGITANCIAPGFIEIDMTKAMEPSVRDEEISRIPAGRIGLPEDIAAAAAFLASDAASFITGQVLSVNGGQYM